MKHRESDQRIAPTSFLWNAYLPKYYYFEVNTRRWEHELNVHRKMYFESSQESNPSHYNHELLCRPLHPCFRQNGGTPQLADQTGRALVFAFPFDGQLLSPGFWFVVTLLCRRPVNKCHTSCMMRVVSCPWEVGVPCFHRGTPFGFEVQPK